MKRSAIPRPSAASSSLLGLVERGVLGRLVVRFGICPGRAGVPGSPVRRLLSVAIVVLGDDQVVGGILEVVLVPGDFGLLLVVAHVIRPMAAGPWITAHGDRLCPEAIAHPRVGQQISRSRDRK